MAKQSRKHPVVRKVLGLGLLAGIAYAIWRAIEANRTPGHEVGWEPQPFPFPPQPRAEGSPNGSGAQATASAAWVEPVDGACPTTHPVKAKLTSGIYHVPGGQSYERTAADRCYADERAAESDGLRKSKR